MPLLSGRMRSETQMLTFNYPKLLVERPALLSNQIRMYPEGTLAQSHQNWKASCSPLFDLPRFSIFRAKGHLACTI